MEGRLITLLLVLSLCFPAYIFAETIVLKTGEKIEGEVVKKTDKYLTVELDSSTYVIYFLNEIESIGEKIPSQESALKEKYKEKKEEFKKPLEETEGAMGNQVRLITFNNKRGDINIRYPEGWFMLEYLYKYPYQIFLSREKIEKPTDMFKVGISIIKWYHQSWYMSLDKNEVDKSLTLLMDEYNDNLSSSDKKIGERKNIMLDGSKGILEEVSFFSAITGFRIRVYQIFAMKDDVVVAITLEAPEIEFENYRQAFEESIQSAKIFSTEDKLGDNHLLDTEIDWFIMNGMGSEEKKQDTMEGTKQILYVFKDAMSMNPLRAKTALLRGGFLMNAASGKDAKTEELLIKNAEEDLKSAIELYNKYVSDYKEPDRELNISQCYYLLGDIYYFLYNKKQEAKDFYDKSLEYFDNLLTKKRLEEYY
jgi:tetratricopeptide (TPR) repeat protein